MTGDYPAATDLLERALALYQDLGSRRGEANALRNLGRVRSMTGDYPAATDLQERALALYQDLGDRRGEADALRNLGRVRYATGDYPAATGLQERALALYQDLGNRRGEARRPPQPGPRPLRDRGLPGRHRPARAGPGAVSRTR